MSDQQRLSTAYASCEQLAHTHYENFPVASLLLPKAMRPHVAAVYAFARLADDFADEGDLPPEQRQAVLDAWLDRLQSAVASGNPGGEPLRGIILAAANTIRQCTLPIGLFEDLVSAFRQDTVKTRYETFEELLDYCRRSANPVGRLVLRIAGCVRPEADAASDNVCTALQLTNFWQDIERDWERGRLYVPLADIRAAHADEEDLTRKRMTPAWQQVMSSLVYRTRSMFIGGRNVADFVDGRLAFELRLTLAGGLRILERIEQQRFDVFGRRPTIRKRDFPLLLWRALAPHTSQNS